MQWNDWLQLAVFLGILVLLTKPMGLYLYRVLEKERTFLDPALRPLERFLYRVCRIDFHKEQTWKSYFVNLLGFSLISLVFVCIIQALQYYLPFNPQKLVAPSWYLNFNTACSFMTNTDWQSYSGETTMSYFTQMTALTVQNFTSAAVGLAVAAALVRGLARERKHTLGNFWVDLIRICLYILLPISLIISVFFMAQGVPQNFKPYVQATTLEGGMPQTIVQGPIASQEAIKILGTNGGGFTNANSAHPYENPTPLSNFIQLLLILLIPTSQLYYFGHSVKNTRHAWCVFTAVSLIYILGVFLCTHSETAGNPVFESLNVVGGNWEGKETRFGIASSALFACTTTVTSCGAVNCCHDSLTPIGGFVPLLNIQFSEAIFGGVGAGLYSILLFVLLSIFISGLIIGRTPEYLGKKIESFDIKMMVLAVLPFVVVIYLFSALACISNWGLSGLGNLGPHGFTEILYAFSSCAANNGSAFAGLNSNSPAYDLTLGIATLMGRFFVIGPLIALAGSFAQKKISPPSIGSFPVDGFAFISILVTVILLLGALNFFAPLTLGPIVEHFFMQQGILSA